MTVKNPWVWVWCVAAGLIVGFILGRGWSEPDDVPQAAQPVPVGGDIQEAPRAIAESPAGPSPGASTQAAQSQGAPPQTPIPVEAPAVPGNLPAGTKSPFMRSVDSGVVTPIDAGDVFNKQIARASTSEQPNPLGDAHRELEREARDDGWAYSMEAELQNSMVSATSTGQFKMEHVECRATICEVRVSGSGDQADAVREWSNTLPSNTFDQRLFMNVSSTIASHERIDAIYIFRRPANNP